MMARDHRAGTTLLQRLMDGPIGEALMERAAEAILKWGKEPAPRPKEIVIDAEFEDIPAKAPRKRRKAPPALPEVKKDEGAPERAEP